MTTHSSILAWEIPWTEEPGGLQSMVSQRVRHDSIWPCLNTLYGRGFGKGRGQRFQQSWWLSAERPVVTRVSCMFARFIAKWKCVASCLKCVTKGIKTGTSLVVQWFRLCTPNAGGVGLIPGWRTKTPHAAWWGKKKVFFLCGFFLLTSNGVFFLFAI